MYLHKKHIHPSVLAVMEREGHKQVNVPASVRKTVSCKVIGESLVLEGYTSTGKKLVAEAVQDDPVLGGKPLFIPINESCGFALNEKGEYVVVEGAMMDMVSKAGAWLSKAWSGFLEKLKKFFTKPGEVEQFEKLLKSDPAKAKQHFVERATAMGKSPKQAETMFKQAQKSYTEKEAKRAGIQTGDQEMINAMAGAADAKSPEEKAAAQQKMDRAHELAMAKQQKGQTVVAGGGSGSQGEQGKQGKPGPDGKTAPTTPPTTPPAGGATPPAPAADDPNAPLKDGDKVYSLDQYGKVTRSGVLQKADQQTIDSFKSQNPPQDVQFMVSDGKGGVTPVMDISQWKKGEPPTPAAAPAGKKGGRKAAPAPAPAPAATPPAATPAPAAATPAAPPEVKPVPPADGSTPTSIPPSAAPEPAAAGLTGDEKGPGPAAPAPDQDQAGQPAAEPAFDPNATMAAPPQRKPGIPAGMKKSKIVNGKRVVGERLMTMAEINRLLRGTK